MLKKILIVFITILTFLNQSFAKDTSNITPWNSIAGIKRLENSKYKNDFYQLANFYQAQINPLYCSAATGTAILNALNHDNIKSQKPAEVTTPSGKLIEFRLYLQSHFFNEKTDKIKSKKIIDLKVKNNNDQYDPGLSLLDFAKILRSYNLKAKVFYADKYDEKAINQFRQNLKKTLNDKNKFIAVNFYGKAIGNRTGGHISLLGAYDQKSDSILVLDAALHKNPWYFVKLNKLYAAMHTKDNNSYRGYVIVAK